MAHLSMNQGIVRKLLRQYFYFYFSHRFEIQLGILYQSKEKHYVIRMNNFLHKTILLCL